MSKIELNGLHSVFERHLDTPYEEGTVVVVYGRYASEKAAWLQEGMKLYDREWLLFDRRHSYISVQDVVAVSRTLGIPIIMVAQDDACFGWQPGLKMIIRTVPPIFGNDSVLCAVRGDARLHAYHIWHPEKLRKHLEDFSEKMRADAEAA